MGAIWIDGIIYTQGKIGINRQRIRIFVKFVWFTVCLTGFCFNGANLYGYIRCKVGGADAVKNMANKEGSLNLWVGYSNHFIFEINVEKRRIRHRTTLNWNDFDRY